MQLTIDDENTSSKFHQANELTKLFSDETHMSTALTINNEQGVSGFPACRQAGIQQLKSNLFE